MKIRHLRWYIAALLFLASVINYIDRQTLSIVAPVLTKELHISPIEYSNILQAFLIAFGASSMWAGTSVAQATGAPPAPDQILPTTLVERGTT